MITKDIMTKEVISVKKDATIQQIAKILTENKISGVPVIDEDEQLIGIVTKKDLLYKDVEPRFPSYVEVLGGIIFVDGLRQYEEELKKLVANTAGDIMTKDVATISEDVDVKKVAEIMVERGVNRLPVLKNKKIVGIVSRGDIVKSLMQ